MRRYRSDPQHNTQRSRTRRRPGLRQALSHLVVDRGWGLLELRAQETSLEEIYLRVVSGEGAPV